MPSQPDKAIGVGMVGYAFMGRAHSLAWHAVTRVFDVPVTPRLAAICGRDKAATVQLADLLTAIADGGQPLPSFADGLAVQRVLDAVARSASTGQWATANRRESATN
jgi:predicted dehydrogenase